MNSAITLFVVGSIAMILSAVFADGAKNKAGATVAGIVAFALFFITTFVAGPAEIGAGNVYWKAEAFTRLLNAGTAYQTIASAKDDKSVVLLVKKTGASDFYMIRAEIVPPEHFTLIDGKPVAITAPVTPPSTK